MSILFRFITLTKFIMLKRFTLLLMLVMNSFMLFSQQNSPAFWTDIAEQNINVNGQYDRFIFPSIYRTVELNVQVLREQLKTATTENAGIIIELPMPDGTTEHFRVWEESVMHPDLQAKYPEIRCYTGKGVEDPYATIKCDITPQGFHAMTLGATKGQVFIDPLYHGYADAGIVYYKKDYHRTAEDHFECLQTTSETEAGEVLAPASPKRNTAQSDFAGDCQKRRYRLALSCTGEYALFHGNTKPLVLAAMNTSMNRVNGVYERDFAVTMQLIPNNDTLIFLNSTTDPFTNGNGGTMLGQNQTTVTARIGSANYDIGHVFSTGGGGVAGLGVVCNSGSKARGVTGSGSPIGDAFDIDYVAHEMGHQFSGQHCFNNSCGGNISQGSAMEPGSGSTIMGYAGICPPDVQSNSDDYFHAINIQEISAFITTGGGNGCPVKTITGNNAPVVDDVPNYIIPKSTPFALTAVATDVDGNALTYCWEQMNNQSGTMPPVSTSVNGPLFRSYDPAASPTRTFPRLPDLVNNVNSTWEELPGVARSMNFRVVVRDNSTLGGCTDEDNVAITVNGTAGPFVVSVPNTNVLWYAGETQPITWDVAGTDLAPVSCANVKISLSTDGGFTYPVVLAENVPNNGSAMVSIPNNISNTCRIKVESVGNIFFDISNVNFRIQVPPTPTFVLSASTTTASICAGEVFSTSITTAGLAGFLDPVDMTITGAPAGANIAFAPASIIPGAPTVLSISGLTSAMAGVYPMIITGTSGSLIKTVQINLTVLPGAPSLAPALSAPSDGAIGIGVSAVLDWAAVDFTETYTIEVCSNPGFTPAGLVTTYNTDTTNIVATGLASATPYYWRVKANNPCGTSAFSGAFAFQTGGEACGNNYSNMVSQAIDVAGVVEINSTLTINDNLSVTDANVSLTVLHTWVGDLDATLFGPSGDSLQLFERPGEPTSADGCEGDNLLVTFDDEAALTAGDFESTCNNAPAISGSFKALGNLSQFDGASSLGTWRLRIRDFYPGFDSGSLENWTLNFCTAIDILAAQLLNNNPLNVVNGATKAIGTAELAGAGATVSTMKRFTLRSLPQNGVLSFDGVAITALGIHFTQQDIDQNKLTYTHSGNGSTTTDQFKFDYLDQTANGWLSDQVFLINIVQNTLSATAAVTQQVACNNGTTGQITVTTTGGTAPLQYSLNGGAQQNTAVFNGLSAGVYAVVVTDANGFTQNAGSFTLNNPAAITATTAVAFDDLTINATGGTGALEYSLDGVAFGASNVFENLTDGIYNYTVRDANGCTATGEVAVSVSALLATVVPSGTILCNGLATGAITVTVVGGFLPYEYSIDGASFQSSNVFSGLLANTYTVTIRDANGTTATATPVTLSQPAAISANTTVLYNSITVIAAGGTGTLTYAINGGTPQSSAVFNGLANGNYTVTVTDANGCTQTTTATVDVAALVMLNVTSIIQDPCTGIADITIEAQGGVPPLEYSLDNTNWQSSAVFANINPGVFTPYVRDAAGTVVAGTAITVVQPVPPSATATVTGNDISIAATGGLAPYTFTLPSGQSNTTGIFENLLSGNYTALVSDANGCTTPVSFSVNYTPPTVSSAVSPVSCNGGSDGSIAWTVNGGLAPYSYMPAPFPSNLPAGTYTVTITDAAGTVLTTSATVTEPLPLLLTVTPNGDGTVSVAATGGNTPYTYSIDGGQNYQASSTFTSVPNGTYDVIVRDSKGCSTTVEGVIVVGANEVFTAWGVQVSPNPSTGIFRLSIGDAPQGDLQIAVLDVLGREIWSQWNTVNGGAFQTNIDLSSMPSGAYVLRLTNGGQQTAVYLVVSE